MRKLGAPILTMIVAVTWLAQGPAAWACEGCKQALQNGKGEQISAATLGYGWSVSFMLFTTFSVLGSLGWMMFRSCQTLARAQRLAEDEDRRRDS